MYPHRFVSSGLSPIAGSPAELNNPANRSPLTVRHTFWPSSSTSNRNFGLYIRAIPVHGTEQAYALAARQPTENCMMRPLAPVLSAVVPSHPNLDGVCVDGSDCPRHPAPSSIARCGSSRNPAEDP